MNEKRNVRDGNNFGVVLLWLGIPAAIMLVAAILEQPVYFLLIASPVFIWYLATH